MLHLIYFFSACVLSFILTRVVIYCMQHWQVVDRVDHTSERKIHTRTTPLGGGIPLYISFLVVAIVVYMVSGGGLYYGFDPRILWGLGIGGGILIIGGLIDDKYTLRPRFQIIPPLLAILVVIGFGIGLHMISNPFGGMIDLSAIQWSVGTWGTIVLFADILVFFWLIGMMFTTKFLDGLDGLATGIVFIGALTIYFVSMQPMWYDPNAGVLALIFAGACLGFLIWNFNPARIFLGEGGSLYIGFMLGALAIMSESKIAITLMVVGIPVIDVMRVIIVRIRRGAPVYVGDREHLHFRLLDSGLTHRQSVFFLYSISLLFGASALFLQAEYRLVALLLIGVLMILIGMWITRQSRVRSV